MPDGKNGLRISRVQGKTKGTKARCSIEIHNSRNRSEPKCSTKCSNKVGFNVWNKQKDISTAILTQNKGPTLSSMLTRTVTTRQQVNLASF